MPPIFGARGARLRMGEQGQDGHGSSHGSNWPRRGTQYAEEQKNRFVLGITQHCSILQALGSEGGILPV